MIGSLSGNPAWSAATATRICGGYRDAIGGVSRSEPLNLDAEGQGSTLRGNALTLPGG